MEKDYVTMQLISGTTILAQVEKELDDNGYYVTHYPLKPVLVGEKIILTSCNPFSDDFVFRIHQTHVITIGSMHFSYIDLYNESVKRIDEQIKQEYNDLLEPEEEKIYIIDETVTMH